jgi:hypothetical protein
MSNTMEQSVQPEPNAAVRRRRRPILIAFLVGAVVIVAILGLTMRHSGLKTRIMIALNPNYRQKLAVPELISTTPSDNQENIELDPTCIINLKIPNEELDAATVNPKTVWLIHTSDQTPVPVNLKLIEDGKRIEVRPKAPLLAGTHYTLTVSAGVADRFQRPLNPFAVAFSTIPKPEPGMKFEQVALPGASGAGFTCLQIGPDKHLWASSDEGRFFRFEIQPDGQLGKPQVFDSLTRAWKGPRIITGFCFDPASTAGNPIVWVSHSFGSFKSPPDFSGAISRLSGPALEKCDDAVIHLPRSVRDHMNNQPSFGPDSALYWSQPSNSSYGAADPIWGMRKEHLLNACILRLDISKWTPGKPIDAQTPDGGGKYDPSAPGAPLTMYATGVRLSYDLLWHSNGHLYSAVNGSAAGGNTPTDGHGHGVALNDICVDEDDWLFSIEKGKFYGHPNPVQEHWVLNGGNPTDGYDYGELSLYPVGTQPEPGWQRAVYDFGRHTSADGMIEYHAVNSNKALDGCILVCRYNYGSDIIALHPDSQGKIVSDDLDIPGLQNLQNPLDLIEDRSTGNLYVSEYGKQQIVLLRAG